MDVFEAALPGVALGGRVQREQPLPSLVWRAGARIEEQVGLGGEAQQRGAEDRAVLRRARLLGNAVALRQNQLRYEQRIAQIRKRVLETLRGVNRAQLCEIRLPIFADEHEKTWSAAVL